MDMPSATESSNLLPSKPKQYSSKRTVNRSSRLSNFCLPSKAAVYVLVSAAVVGCMYYTLLGTTVAFIVSSSDFFTVATPVYFSIPYALLALVMVSYPLSGFIADVYCGRFRIITISLCFLLLFLTLVCLIVIMGMTKLHSVEFYDYRDLFHRPFGIFIVILSILALTSYILGLAGYQANFIQFGLDQLVEVPSHYLGLFIHYVVLAFQLGSIPPILLFPLSWCSSYKRNIVHYALCSIPIIVLLLVSILLFVRWRNKQWFFSESGQENPYKTVFRIINFARKNKYPLRPSAFTYSDNYIPSRLDFAKVRYGGPFTTEEVENVKTFVRILLVLLSIGPVFMLEVPASHFLFPLFGFHMLHYKGAELCVGEHAWETLFIGSGSFMLLLSVMIIFPLYIYITFSSCQLKLFTRIQIGVILCLLGVASLLITDTIGHSRKQVSFNQTNTQSMCMFQFYMINDTTILYQYPTLDLHWSVLIPPNLFLGIGPVLVITTTLEFISAQSPQLMKGFLIGVFFAIRGLYHFLNVIVITPLSLDHPWASGEMLVNPPVTNCGFVYLLFTCVVGGIGFILLSIASKKYKYRKRDEGMFRQQVIEEIYDRYLNEVPRGVPDWGSPQSFNLHFFISILSLSPVNERH